MQLQSDEIALGPTPDPRPQVTGRGGGTSNVYPKLRAKRVNPRKVHSHGDFRSPNIEVRSETMEPKRLRLGGEDDCAEMRPSTVSSSRRRSAEFDPSRFDAAMRDGGWRGRRSAERELEHSAPQSDLISGAKSMMPAGSQRGERRLHDGDACPWPSNGLSHNSKPRRSTPASARALGPDVCIPRGETGGCEDCERDLASLCYDLVCRKIASGLRGTVGGESPDPHWGALITLLLKSPGSRAAVLDFFVDAIQSATGRTNGPNRYGPMIVPVNISLLARGQTIGASVRPKWCAPKYNPPK